MRPVDRAEYVADVSSKPLPLPHRTHTTVKSDASVNSMLHDAPLSAIRFLKKGRRGGGEEKGEKGEEGGGEIKKEKCYLYFVDFVAFFLKRFQQGFIWDFLGGFFSNPGKILRYPAQGWERNNKKENGGHGTQKVPGFSLV